MVKTNTDDYLDYEDGLGERPKHSKKKIGPPTASDKAEREEEVRLAKESQVIKAKEKIKNLLLHFPDIQTNEGQGQLQKYIRWVKDSLQLNRLQFNPENKDEVKIDTFVASVKAGGQHRQKNQTAIRVTHLPTKITAQNQSERITDQNKKAALETLVQRLESHLEIWKTLAQNSPTPIDIKKEVISLLPTKIPYYQRCLSNTP